MSQTELYEPNEIENEMFLSTVPLNLLEEAIKTQFDDPIEYRKTDYIQSFLNKYQFSLDNMYEEDQAELDELHDEFIQFLKDIIHEYLGIGIPNIEDYPEEDQHKILHYTYRFFITNIKKNFTQFICRYIEKYKTDITAIAVKKRDVISLNFKSEISDSYDILVLSNLGTIIDYILSGSYDVDEFFELCSPNSLNLEVSALNLPKSNILPLYFG